MSGVNLFLLEGAKEIPAPLYLWAACSLEVDIPMKKPQLYKASIDCLANWRNTLWNVVPKNIAHDMEVIRL